MDSSSGIVWLNGEFSNYEDAKVSVDDRGFYFGDGVYEVIRVYDGVLFSLDRHLARLERSAAGIELPLPRSLAGLSVLIEQLVRQTGIANAEAYVQVTRGAARRNHLFPENTQPTLLVGVRRIREVPPSLWETGCRLITLPDQRWARCDLKTICLLPNVLAKQAAHRAGVFDAILVRDGVVTEATASNIFICRAGGVLTPIADNRILPGITRAAVIDLLGQLGVSVAECDLTPADLLSADEVFITSTTVELMPVAFIDGHPIGSGQPGDNWSRLYSAFRKLTPRLRAHD